MNVSSGELSAADACKHYLLKIEKLNAKLNAYVNWDRDRVLNAARRIDTPPKRTSSPGKLKGVPIAVKDLFDYEGMPTRAGSLATSDLAAASSARVVKKLEDAGAVILGKTQSVEFAFGGWGTNPVMGTPWNPWDLDVHRVPGGSSSGSAVAVASGMAMAALGTDTGGSVRTPASYCGLVGTKTSMGLVSRHGVFPLCPTHDTVGTLTRHVLDAAIMLQVVCGTDPEDPRTQDAPTLDFLSGIDNGVDGLNIAVLPERELAAANTDVRCLYNTALNHLQQAGARFSEFSPPHSLNHYLEHAGKIMSAESYSSLGALVDDDDSPIAPEIRARIIAGKQFSASDHEEMLEARQSEGREFLDAFAGYDALVTPTCSSTAIPVSEVDETAIVTSFGRFVNYLDLCAASVPMGLTPSGLPVGLQIVARKYSDPLALQIARTLEQRVPIEFPPDLDGFIRG